MSTLQTDKLKRVKHKLLEQLNASSSKRTKTGDLIKSSKTVVENQPDDLQKANEKQSREVEHNKGKPKSFV